MYQKCTSTDDKAECDVDTLIVSLSSFWFIFIPNVFQLQAICHLEVTRGQL